MKVNLNQEIKNLEGETIVAQDKTPLTLKFVITNSLLITHPQEKDLDGNTKMKRYNLAHKIHKANEIDLSSEEIVEIKTMIGKVYNTLVYGYVNDILEGKTE